MLEVNNRKARFDYEVLDTIEAGIALTGTEIKSVKNASVNIKDSYAIIRNSEAFLLNTYIGEYKEGNIFNHEERRTRKLLLHKKEIFKLRDRIALEGITIVPLKMYFVKNKVKVLLGIAKGRKNYDKREALKKKDNLKEIKQAFKSQNR